jgi:hypothetical protein
MGTPRRVVLAGGLAGAAATLAGCWKPGGNGAKPDAKSSAHTLTAVLAGTLALVARYDATIAAQPTQAARLAPLRAEHWAHVTALYTAMGRPAPSAAPSPAASGAPPATLPALRTAERTAQSDAVAACLAAPAQYAELLGSIAASRACHLEVLP